MLQVITTNPTRISVDSIEFTVSNKGVVRAVRANHTSAAIEAARPQAKAWASVNITNHNSQALVHGAAGTEADRDSLDSLYEDVTDSISKKDKRGEQDYRDLKAKLVDKMVAYISILRDDPIKALDELTANFEKKIENVKVNRLVLAEWLCFSSEDIEYMVGSTIKVLIKETVMHEQALNATASMIAKRIKPLMSRSALNIPIKRKLELGEYELLAAAQLMLIAQQLGFYTVGSATAKARDGMDFKHSYKTTKFVYHVTDNLRKYISKKTDVEAKTYEPKAELLYSGSYNKYTPSQPAVMIDVIKKLQAPAYRVNKKMATTFLKNFQATLPMEEALKLPDFLSELGDSSFHFIAKLGPDNARFYLGGYFVPAQQGGRNWIVEFANKLQLTASGKAALKAKLDSYDHKAMVKAPAKKKLEYMSYLSMQEDVDAGLPIGQFIGLDGKLMGMQTHALLLQDATQYHYCVNEDGRVLMASELGLTKNGVKGGISPYSYGAGEKTTIKGILKFAAEGGEDELAKAQELVGTPDFWSKWEKSFQSYFPATFKLRQFVRGYAQTAKLGCRVDYTSWAGASCTITPLKTIETYHDTVLGQVAYKREEVIVDEFGSKLVAAIGHELDSSILTKLILGADYAIKPVHDEYCVHPNNCAQLEADFTQITCELRAEGPDHLFTLINEMFCDYVDIYGPINTNVLITGDLKDSDIACGIN